jgi:hypothetical protein
MPRGHNKIGSGRAVRILRIGRDLFSIALKDLLLGRILVSVLSNDGRPFLGRDHKRFCDFVFEVSGGSTEESRSTAQTRLAQKAAADRKKRIAVACREMAKLDRKTVKIFRARYAACLGGKKAEASRTLEAIMSLQAQHGWAE